MKYTAAETTGALREVIELLETSRFSFETVSMALNIGRGHQSGQTTLQNRLIERTTDEVREAALVAVEALATASAAFDRLIEIFDLDENVALGYSIGFWSTYEWCFFRLFTEQTHHTGQLVLQYEIAEALHRTRELEHRLNGHVFQRYIT